MKSLSKKAIVSSVVAILIVPSVAFGAWQATHKPVPKVQEPVAANIDPIIYPEKKAETPAPSQEPTPVAEVQAPAPAPVILSSDEYAAKYLDLSSTFLQECWTIIKEMYPDRFTEQLREKSIQRIAPAYKNICGFGKIMMYETSDGVVHRYNSTLGKNGEYFDR